ncbi:unnamed protein product [Gordionus sp. m RMFG-2023]
MFSSPVINDIMIKSSQSMFDFAGKKKSVPPQKPETDSSIINSSHPYGNLIDSVIDSGYNSFNNNHSFPAGNEDSLIMDMVSKIVEENEISQKFKMLDNLVTSGVPRRCIEKNLVGFGEGLTSSDKCSTPLKFNANFLNNNIAHNSTSNATAPNNGLINTTAPNDGLGLNDSGFGSTFFKNIWSPTVEDQGIISETSASVNSSVSQTNGFHSFPNGNEQEILTSLIGDLIKNDESAARVLMEMIIKSGGMTHHNTVDDHKEVTTGKPDKTEKWLLDYNNNFCPNNENTQRIQGDVSQSFSPIVASTTVGKAILGSHNSFKKHQKYLNTPNLAHKYCPNGHSATNECNDNFANFNHEDKATSQLFVNHSNQINCHGPSAICDYSYGPSNIFQYANLQHQKSVSSNSILQQQNYVKNVSSTQGPHNSLLHNTALGNEVPNSLHFPYHQLQNLGGRPHVANNVILYHHYSNPLQHQHYNPQGINPSYAAPPNKYNFLHHQPLSAINVAPQPQSIYRFNTKKTYPCLTLQFFLEECFSQFKCLEKERKKCEAELARTYPGRNLCSNNTALVPHLSSNPSRVDRMIVDHWKEHSKVVTLLGKIDGLHKEESLPLGMFRKMDVWINCVKVVQYKRKEEIENGIMNNGTSSKNPALLNGSANSPMMMNGHHSPKKFQDDKDIMALSLAIKELARATKIARTALWSALNFAVDKGQNTPIGHNLLKMLENENNNRGTVARKPSPPTRHLITRQGQEKYYYYQNGLNASGNSSRLPGLKLNG